MMLSGEVPPANAPSELDAQAQKRMALLIAQSLPVKQIAEIVAELYGLKKRPFIKRCWLAKRMDSGHRNWLYPIKCQCHLRINTPFRRFFRYDMALSNRE